MRRTVQEGYDALAHRFADWMQAIDGDPWERFLPEVEARLDDGARVLDLGCGAGVPKTKRLAKRFDVLGIDVSEEQVRRARAEAPEATFLQADFAELDFPAEAFDAVTAFYSFMHVPRREHPTLFRRIERWLKPGGLLLASLSHVGGDDRTEKWLGSRCSSRVSMPRRTAGSFARRDSSFSSTSW